MEHVLNASFLRSTQPKLKLTLASESSSNPSSAVTLEIGTSMEISLTNGDDYALRATGSLEIASQYHDGGNLKGFVKWAAHAQNVKDGTTSLKIVDTSNSARVLFSLDVKMPGGAKKAANVNPELEQMYSPYGLSCPLADANLDRFPMPVSTVD